MNVPHAPDGVLGLQANVTPEFEESLDTVTAMGALVLILVEAGGGVEKETEIEGGGGGGVLPPPPPQAIKVEDRQARMNRGASCRFIASPSQNEFLVTPGDRTKDSELYQKFTEA